MEIYAQKLQKTEKSGNLQLILAVTNSKITFPCGKITCKKKSHRSGMAFCSKSNKKVLNHEVALKANP